MKVTSIIFLNLFLFFNGINPIIADEIEDNSVTHPQTEAECTSAGRQWDSEVNRCLYTEEVVETRENYQNCAESEDSANCHMNLAEDMTGVQQGDGLSKKDETLSTGGAAVATLYSVMLGVSGSAAGQGGGGMCISKMLFIGTSVAWLGGDLYLKYQAKKQFKDLQEEYDEESKNTENKGEVNSSFESQIRAFVYLKKEQLIVQQQAKNRFTMHIMATAGYGISAVMALMDMLKPGGGSCGGGGEESTDTASTEAGGDATTTGGEATATAGEPAPSGAKANLSSPPLIMASSIAMAAVNGMLAKKMKDAEKLAESRVKIIDDIMNSFIESMAGFCPDGREDLSNARCYCYTDSGTKNENRTNSAICQALWEQDYKNFHVDASQYDIASSVSNGCITVNGKFDLDCKCKSMINTETGQNACYKTSTMAAGSISTVDSDLGISALASQFDSVTSGASTALANLNSKSLAGQAARANKAFGALSKKAKSQGIDLGKVNGTLGNENLALAYANKHTTPSLLAEAKKGLLSSLASSARPAGTDLEKALEQAEKVTAQAEADVSVSGGKGTASLNNSGKKNGKFKFNWNEDAKKSIENYTESEKEQVNAMVSDIVTEESVSIWEVISNRYISSGLKRLFGKNDK